MKIPHTKLTCLLVLGMTMAASLIRAETTNTVSELVQGNNTFALDLYGKLKSTEGNLFFSPYSISTCLAMTYAGARGETEQQMAQVLHFSTNQNQLHSSFGQLQKQLSEAKKQDRIQIEDAEQQVARTLLSSTNQNQSLLSQLQKQLDEGKYPDGIQFDIANALWAQMDHPLLPSFLKHAEESYGALLKQVDFNTQRESALKEINDWVAKKTNGRIENILQPDSLNPDTKLALVNTIYFKGEWLFKFDTNSTSQQPFTISQGQSKKVSMMHKGEGFRYYQDEHFQALEMPYVGSRFWMLILLPQKQDGLKALETKLTAETLSRVTSSMKGRHVDVFLPRFKVSFGTELSECLKSMGMPAAFDRNADFSGMDGAKDLYISDLFHKAYADVNEVGTEAAASTVVAMSNGIELDPPIFRADHPFVFLIRDMKSNTILFMGRVTDPTM